MERERFWVGTVIVAVPVIWMIWALFPRHEVKTSGLVDGYVSIDGRPMPGGTIFFLPEDESGRAAYGTIDEDGHYFVESDWVRRRRRKSPFRICLIPDAGSAATGDGGGVDVLAALPRGFRRLADPHTSILRVRLDARPAEIDIAL